VLIAKAKIEEEKRKRFIAERETAWRDVAFKAAHKLGNPVDATDTFLQSLKRKLLDHDFERGQYIAGEMDKSIEEAKSVIGQFKSLTKIEEINSKPTQLVEIIKQACVTAEQQNVEVNIDAPNDLPLLLIDPEKTKECFDELVANSLHWFDKENRMINIKLSKEAKKNVVEPLDTKKSYVVITYQDNGSGIRSENKEKIFSPFFTTYQHGTGLGLSIVRKVIELQNGWISENGKPNENAIFTIHLPIAPMPKKNIKRKK
ncbi:MAG: sensor histidine kinase, partial [Flavobacteriales bacterium]